MTAKPQHIPQRIGMITEDTKHISYEPHQHGKASQGHDLPVRTQPEYKQKMHNADQHDSRQAQGNAQIRLFQPGQRDHTGNQQQGKIMEDTTQIFPAFPILFHPSPELHILAQQVIQRQAVQVAEFQHAGKVRIGPVVFPVGQALAADTDLLCYSLLGQFCLQPGIL